MATELHAQTGLFILVGVQVIYYVYMACVEDYC